MSNFRYQVRDAHGQIVEGTIQAATVQAAIELLSSQGQEVVAVRMLDLADGEQAEHIVTPTREVQPRPQYLTRLDRILEDRHYFLAALEAITQEQPHRFGNELAYLSGQIKNNITAEQFLADPKLVTWLPVLTAGHDPATLQLHYRRWVNQVGDQQQRASKWMWAMSYPLFLVVISVVVLTPIFIWIVPLFRRMFYEFGLSLPAPTRLLVRFTDLVENYPMQLLTGIVAVMAVILLLVRYWNSIPATTVLFGMFTAGSNPNLLAMSRLTSVLAEMLHLGAPLSDSFQVAADATRFAYYRNLYRRLALEVRNDPSAWQRSALRHMLPPLLMQALSIGPGPASAIGLLRELSQLYSERTQQRIKSNAGLATPLVVGFIGVTIAFVVVALFMPLIQMITSLT